jgi:hypothetical protein
MMTRRSCALALRVRVSFPAVVGLCSYVQKHDFEGVVSVIFDKAVNEPFFTPMYADLVLKIHHEVPPVPDTDTPEGTTGEAGSSGAAAAAATAAAPKMVNLRTLLLVQCQKEFERGTEAPVPVTTETGATLTAEQLEELQIKQKRKSNDKIRLLGFKSGE